MIFQKKGKLRRRRFANFKKFAFGVWGRPNKPGKGYPFPLLAINAVFIFYMIFIASNYFLIDNYIKKSSLKIYAIFLKRYFKIIKKWSTYIISLKQNFLIDTQNLKIKIFKIKEQEIQNR